MHVTVKITGDTLRVVSFIFTPQEPSMMHESQKKNMTNLPLKKVLKLQCAVVSYGLCPPHRIKYWKVGPQGELMRSGGTFRRGCRGRY
jgi:hypothetical protein